jgi:tetratricopeptide (TPR) repeat protein
VDLGTRLRQLRLEQGLTQSELAEPAYSYAYVSSIEAGRRTPSPKALEFFATKLGIPPQELATGRSPARELELMADYLAARSLLSSGDEADRQEAVKTLRRLAKKAHEIAAHDLVAKSRFGFALAAEANNDLAAALELYEQIEKDTAEITLSTRVDATAGRARVLQSQGRTTYAAFLLREALARLEDAGLTDPAALVRLHTSLVAAYFAEGLTDMAIESAEIALALTPMIEDPERLADLNLNYGIALTRLGRRKEAAIKLAEAERWFNNLGREIDAADVRLVRGIGLGKEGRYDEADEHLRMAQTVLASAGATLRESRASLALGINARMGGDLDQARFLLKKAMSAAGEDTGIVGIAHRELGLCEQNDMKKAVKEIRKAIEILKDGGNAPELAATYSALGDVLSKTDDLRPACDAYRAAAEVLIDVA